MLAILFTSMCNTWGFYIFLSDLPTFLSTVLGDSVQHAGAVASMSFAGIAIATPLFGVACVRAIYSTVGY